MVFDLLFQEPAAATLVTLNLKPKASHAIHCFEGLRVGFGFSSLAACMGSEPFRAHPQISRFCRCSESEVSSTPRNQAPDSLGLRAFFGWRMLAAGPESTKPQCRNDSEGPSACGVARKRTQELHQMAETKSKLQEGGRAELRRCVLLVIESLPLCTALQSVGGRQAGKTLEPGPVYRHMSMVRTGHTG